MRRESAVLPTIIGAGRGGMCAMAVAIFLLAACSSGGGDASGDAPGEAAGSDAAEDRRAADLVDTGADRAEDLALPDLPTIPDAAPELVPDVPDTGTDSLPDVPADTTAEAVAEAVSDADTGTSDVAEDPPGDLAVDNGAQDAAPEITPPPKNPLVLVDETEDRLPEITGDSRYVEHADVDGDGDEDLFLAVASNAVSVQMLNDGTGHFPEATPLPGGPGEATGLAAADFDGDGAVDLFVARSNEPSLLLLNQQGTLVDATAASLGSFNVQAERALAADLDGDTDIDLVVITSGSQPKKLLLNDGKGKLTVADGFLPPDTLMGASGSLGSVDGIGPPDLAFACFISSQTTRLWLNDGTAHFTDGSANIQPAYESIGFDAVLADLDGDKDLDLFEANLMNLQRVLLNNGKGKLTEFPIGLPKGLGYFGDGTLMATDAEVGDIDLDGDNDVLVGCSGNTPGLNQEVLLLNNGMASFSTWKDAPFPEDGGDTRHTAFVDVDGDLDLDVIVVNSLSQTRLYVNQ